MRRTRVPKRSVTFQWNRTMTTHASLVLVVGCALAFAVNLPAGAPAASSMRAQADTIRTLDSAIVHDSIANPRSANLRAFLARRRAGGMGYFFDQERLDALHPALASEALRGVPGIVLNPTRALINQVRMRGCAPLVWVDGQRATGAELDEVARAPDVAGMEVYLSQVGVPATYADRTAACGTILVWTRPG